MIDQLTPLQAAFWMAGIGAGLGLVLSVAFWVAVCREWARIREADKRRSGFGIYPPARHDVEHEEGDEHRHDFTVPDAFLCRQWERTGGACCPGDLPRADCEGLARLVPSAGNVVSLRLPPPGSLWRVGRNRDGD